MVRGMTRRADLVERIVAEQRRLAAIEADARAAAERLAELQRELDACQPTSVGEAAPRVEAGPTTPAEKVALFRSLFRGRTDVFPRRWENAKTGRKGYAPACSNEWVRGVCEKPRVKCGECPHQAFIEVGDRELLDHLQGRHVMGVYALLEDETCHFLAADFDKESWREDVAAYRETCRAFDIPVAIERSRSGNGAHAWFFFTDRVAAATARRMASLLLTETMSRRHELSMASYDRLFPNQDTMPRGGFGNLIALPLQYEPRRAGNSVFVDDRFEPYADQWAFLAGVVRMEPSRVESLAADADRHGGAIGLRWPDDEDAATPWRRSPSRRPRRVEITGPLPPEVNALLAQRVFVEKAGLPSPLLNQIKRLAAFPNAEFHKKQNLRLSTAMTPRVIACAEEHPQHVALPRGCRDDLEELLRGHGVRLRVTDERQGGVPLDRTFVGELTPVQQSAARMMLRHDPCVFVAPPGSGKTVVGAHLVAARGVNALVLVHRKPLLDQWIAQLAVFLGVDPASIGRIGGGKDRPTGVLDVAMIQSLVRDDGVDDRIAVYGHVVVDECHHLPAVTFERVLAEAKARFVTGLTATPYRRDGHHPIVAMQCGPVRYALYAKDEAAARKFTLRLVRQPTGFQPPAGDGSGIQALYGALGRDDARNARIVEDVRAALADGRSPLVLTERRDHLELLAERLKDAAPHVVVLRGGDGTKRRRAILAELGSIPRDEQRLVLATGRYVGEGFDDARLDTLFLVMPVSWKGTVVQYAGRLLRRAPGKTEVRIHDYVDALVPLLAKMAERRLRGYRAIGFEEGRGPTQPVGPVGRGGTADSTLPADAALADLGTEDSRE
jgi:superfamily II DNA or RNA helicase